MSCAIILFIFDRNAEKVREKSKELTQEETVRLSDVKKFPIQYWLTVAVYALYYVSVFPFISIGK